MLETLVQDTPPGTAGWARRKQKHAPPLLPEWLVVDDEGTSARHAATHREAARRKQQHKAAAVAVAAGELMLRASAQGTPPSTASGHVESSSTIPPLSERLVG